MAVAAAQLKLAGRRRLPGWPPAGWSGVLSATAVASWAYALVAAAWLSGRFTGGEAPEACALWIALPLQVACFLAVVVSVVWPLRGARPLGAWAWWIAAFCVTDLIANYVWNDTTRASSSGIFDLPDLLFLACYGVLTAAILALYRELSGRLRDGRLVLDAATVFGALLAAMWAVLALRPAAAGVPPGFAMRIALPYMAVLSVLLTVVLLVHLRVPVARANLWVHAVLAAAVLEAAWEVCWLSSWLMNRDIVGAYYNFGDVLSLSLLLTALAQRYRLRDAAKAPLSLERNAAAFVPALAAMTTITVVAAVVSTSAALESWVLVGLVVFCALLLSVRHYRAQRELNAMHLRLALQRADERLTELVRTSTDLILVTDPHGLIRFASPAAIDVVQRPGAELIGTSVVELFGQRQSGVVAGFLKGLDSSEEPAVMEVAVEQDGAPERVIRITGRNQLHNDTIGGLTLSVSDVSEQRRLERHALNVQTEERLRLAADIHDGLGQELAGLAMMLQSIVSAANTAPGSQREQLQRVITRLNESIRSARDLARGLSPLEVVRGSLGHALRSLADTADGRCRIEVDIEPMFYESVIGDFPAENLCRIATEAILNAISHSRCSELAVRLGTEADDLVLTVSDNGAGFAAHRRRASGLGLRLMDYRARLIGGRCVVETVADRGTAVQVRVPMRAVARVKRAQPAIA